ncbi:hypothetical protein [Bacillus sp. AK031]
MVRVRIGVAFGQEKRKKSGQSPNQGGIRTGKEEKGQSESESGVHSDSKRGKGVVRVRIGVAFGQEKRKRNSQSPNRGGIRTAKEEKEWSESESGWHSDSKRGKGTVRVRIGVAFGQQKRKRSGQSPNQGGIRTAEAEKEWSEPESGWHSDRKSGKGVVRVRIGVAFGQHKRKRDSKSPNWGGIRTAQEEKE